VPTGGRSREVTEPSKRKQQPHLQPTHATTENILSYNRESNDHRSREATEVGLLQSKIVGFRKCSGENSFSDTAFYKDKDLR
jgi:hypothetical protein